jgi:hypothetical protein
MECYSPKPQDRGRLAQGFLGPQSCRDTSEALPMEAMAQKEGSGVREGAAIWHTFGISAIDYSTYDLQRLDLNKRS